MPKADFFAKLGLYVNRHFLDPTECAMVRSEMATCTQNELAGVTMGGVDSVNVEQRSTRFVKASKETKVFLRTKLIHYTPVIGQHYGMTLKGIENPQFLIYREGDFFHVHTDSDASPDAHEYARERKVSVVLFVNGNSGPPDEHRYQGGSLTLYNLVQGPAWEGKGFDLETEPGLLFTFPSEIPHEVKPVTEGERYTVVAWYHGDLQ